MSLSDAQIQEALGALLALSLVFESSGGRAARWEHNLQRVLGVPEQSASLLGLLMLRGPQTAGELRINAERWHRFADISSVEAFLQELHDRHDDKGGPLVARLARSPGAREQRWTHLLCGHVESAPASTDYGTQDPDHPRESASSMAQRVTALEQEVAVLREQMAVLHSALGMSPPVHAQ